MSTSSIIRSLCKQPLLLFNSPLSSLSLAVPSFHSLSRQELINKPVVIAWSVRLEHFSDRIALAVRLDAQIACEGVDILQEARKRDVSKGTSEQLRMEKLRAKNAYRKIIVNGVGMFSTHLEIAFSRPCVPDSNLLLHLLALGQIDHAEHECDPPQSLHLCYQRREHGVDLTGKED